LASCFFSAIFHIQKIWTPGILRFFGEALPFDDWIRPAFRVIEKRKSFFCRRQDTSTGRRSYAQPPQGYRGLAHDFRDEGFPLGV
jgi:hypothetical protein